MQHKLQNTSNPDDPKYDPLTIVVFAEGLKIVISCIGLLRTLPTDVTINYKCASWLRLIHQGHHIVIIPAILYTVAAASQAVGARNLSLMPYLMLSQVKLILTPIFGIILLKQILSPLQWSYLILMTVGTVLVQLGLAKNSLETMVSIQGQDVALGTVSMVIASICVAFSGVYMEACFKANSNFLARNAQLAGYSCVFGLLGIVLQPATVLKDFFKEWNAFVWGLVALQVVGGFIVSWCVRITSTVAKNYAQAMGFLVASINPLLSVSGTMNYTVGFYM